LFILNSALAFSQVAEFNFLDKTTVKWGKVNEGEKLTHYFVFENSGNAPLLIEDAQVACPCTKVEFPKHPVSPGAKDSIKVTFDTEGKFYYQDRVVKLVANTKKEEKLRLKVYVIPKEEE
jgi:hypothetical protein